MGTTIIISCESCGHSDEYMLGVGMTYSSLENVIEEVPFSNREHVLSILKRDDLMKTDFSHSLYACPKCETLFERFHYRIVYGDSEVYKSEHKCSLCKTKLVIARNNISKYRCPKCKARTLKKENYLLWD